MRQLPEIMATYDWIVDQMDREGQSLTRAGERQKLEALSQKRDILERAFFVLMFGQFENDVTDKFETTRAAKITNPDWTQRRGWDVPALASKKVPFDTRLAMVMDRQKPSFGAVLNSYATRNHCAHGGLSEPVGAIRSLEKDLYAWQADLGG